MSSSTALLASLPSWDLTENCPIGTAHLAHQCHWPRALLRFPGIFYLFIYLLTYLAALGLSCSQALDRPSLQHEGSSAVASELSVVAAGSSSLIRDGT